MNKFKPIPGEAVFWTFKEREKENPIAKLGIYCIHAISAGHYMYPISRVIMKPYNDEKAKAYAKWDEI